MDDQPIREKLKFNEKWDYLKWKRRPSNKRKFHRLLRDVSTNKLYVEAITKREDK